LPPSLKNIYEELKNEGFDMNLENGDLTPWVKQGVFLLNSALTVKPNSPNLHITLWKYFTSKVIKYIYEKSDPIFMLFGLESQKFESFIPGKENIIKTSHPSPRSYTRGFKGSNCFNQANNLLRMSGKKMVNWNIK
jgi:uracil-DNA glycosylase